MLTRRRQVAAKIESVEGTAETISNSDAAIRAENPVFRINPDPGVRDYVSATFSKEAAVFGKIPFSYSFGVKMAGSGSVGTDAEWFKYLKACGWQVESLYTLTIGAVTSGPFTHGETITGGVSGATGRVVIATADGTTTLYYVPISGTFQNETVTGGTSGASATAAGAGSEAGDLLRPVSDPASVPSLTMADFLDGTKKLGKGARGKVKFNFSVGMPVMLSFEFMGAFVSQTDVALLSGISRQTTLPPVFVSAALAIGSYAAKLRELEIDGGGSVALREDQNEARGILSALITNRTIVGSFNPEKVVVATHDFYGKIFSSNEMVLDFILGATTGNKFRFYAPKVQYRSAEDEDADGIATERVQLSFNKMLEAGDDELCILAL